MSIINIMLIFSVLHNRYYSYTLGLNSNYQYYSDIETIDFTLKNYYHCGMWFKYQPMIGLLQVGMISASQSNSSLLFYRTFLDNEDIASLSFISINFNEKRIQLQTRINFNQQLFQTALNIDPFTIDGLWIYHYYLFQKQQSELFSIKIGYINANTQDSHSFFNVPLFETKQFSIIYGGGLEKYDKSFNEYFYLTYFLGVIEPEVENDNDDPQVLFEMELQFDNPDPFSQIIVQDAQLSNYLQANSLSGIYDKYKITFWIKLNKYLHLTEGLAYIFHISGILANDFKEKTGGNVAYMYYKVTKDKLQLYFGYYSYIFPYFSENTDPYKRELIIDMTLSEEKWYLIKLQYENKILQLRIINEELHEKYLISLENINQFTSPLFYFYLGGDLQSQSTIQGIISLLHFSTDFDTNNIECHFTCQTCNGPYSTNCLTCSEENGRQLIYGKCPCKIEFLEIDQQDCYDFSQNELIENPKSSSETLCPFGYFLYDEECFQWYLLQQSSPSGSQHFYIFCQECIVNWRNWIYNPICTLDIQSNYVGTYLQKLNSEQYYTFDQGQLYLCEDCSLCLDMNFYNDCYLYKYLHLNRQVFIFCRNRKVYSASKQECVYDNYHKFPTLLCPKNCGGCTSYHRCIYCKDPKKYYLTIDFMKCLECSIKFCKYCFQANLNNIYDLSSSTLYQNIGDSSMFISDDIVTYCAQCYDGYTFNIINAQCEEIELPSQCKQAYVTMNNDIVCLISVSDNFNNNEISITNCLAFMLNCLECIHNKHQRLFCLKCIPGYYVDYNFGICQSCQDQFDLSEVKECQMVNHYSQDQWMIDIQPFYNAFFIGQSIYLPTGSFRRFVNIIQCQNNYDLFNYECHQNLNTCQQTGYAEKIYYCQICKNSDQQSFSYDPNNLQKCLTCPYQCKYCQPRSQIDIDQKNPDFNSDTQQSNYCIKPIISSYSVYFDTQFMSPIICQNFKECQLTLKFSMHNQLLDIPDQNLIRYMNIRKITSIICVFNYTQSTEYIFEMDSLFKIKQQVFSITQIIAHILGKESRYFIKGRALLGITEIVFQDTTLIFLFNFNTNQVTVFMNQISGTSLKILNSLVKLNEDSPQYNKNFAETLNINNMHLIQFTNSTFKDMYLLYDFFVFKTQFQESQIILENMIFDNISFYNCSLFRLNNQNQLKEIIIKNLKLINCTFALYSAFILFQQNYFYNGSIIISNVTITDSIFIDSNLFNFHSVNKLQIFDIKMEKLRILNSTLLIFQSCKNAIIKNLFIENIFIEQSNVIHIDGNIILSISYLNFQSSITLNQFSTLIYMQNSDNSNVSITYIDQKSIEVNKISCFYQMSGNTINLSDLFIEKSSINKDFCLSFFQVNVQNIEIYSGRKLFIDPFMDCLNLEFYHNTFLLIDSFITINIFNVTARNLLYVNSSLVQIQKQLSSDKQQITLNKISLYQNIILKLTVNLVSTFIYIYSDSKLIVNLSEIIFDSNWINHYLIDFQIISPGLIYIVAYQISLFNSSFQSNQITNTSESLIQFNSIVVNITDIFIDNAISPLKLFFPANELIIANNRVVNKIFPINSQGGQFLLKCQNLIFKNSYIANSLATIGGAIIIQVQLEGNIHFQNNTFINTTAKSQTTLLGIGGCLYLDASSSSLIFNFINNTISSSNSKYIGGAIFIQPSKVLNFIKLSQLIISNVHSLKGALLYCLFPEESTNNTIIIQKIQIQINEQSFKDYVMTQEFTDYDDQFWPAQTGIIHIINSAIYIKDLEFSGLCTQPLFNLLFRISLIMKSIQISNVQQISNSIITLQKYSTVFEVEDFQLQNFLIKNVQIITFQSIICPPASIQAYNYSFCSLKNIHVEEQQNQDCLIQQKKAFINNNEKAVFMIRDIQDSKRNKIQNIIIHTIECKLCQEGILTMISTGLLMKFIVMKNNICGQTGCLSIKQDKENVQKRTITLSNSFFFNNSAGLGGALYVGYVNLKINHTKIIQNFATFGGGIYFISNGNILLLVQTEIIMNTAEINAGGVMMLNYSVQDLNSINIQNNLAKNGVNNLFSQISFLKLNIYGITLNNYRINKQTDFASINNSSFVYVPSGQHLNKYDRYDQSLQKYENVIINPKIIPYNQLGEQLQGIEECECSVYQNVDLQFSSINRTKLFSVGFNSVNNYYDLRNLVINFNPYVENSYSGVQISVVCQNQIDENYTFYFQFRTFFCQPGEYIATNSCLKCDSTKGQYSVKANQTECYKYDSNSMKSITSSELNLNIGYWRQHREINIPVFCYKAYQNCLGGWGTGDSTCSKGNIGALCEECDIYNIRGDGKYQKQQGQSCSLCGEIAGIIIKVLFITIWTLGSIWVTVQSTSNSNDQLKKLKMMTNQYEILFKQSQDKAGSLIKMLANYCQIILALKTFQLSLFLDFTNLLEPISDPTSSFSYSIDCYLSLSPLIPIIYGRIIWMVGLTFFYFILYNVLYFIYCKSAKVITKKSTITTSMLYLFTYTQPSLMNELVSLVAFKNISGTDYIKANLSYQYFTTQHFYWMYSMVLPLITISAVIIPGIIYSKLTIKRKYLNGKNIREIWGYMYYEYKKGNYYWELVKIIQRVMIIVILNYLDSDITIKAILICYIVFIYHKFFSQQLPYCLTYLNNFEKYHIFFCALIVMSGNLLYQTQIYDNLAIQFILQSLIVFVIIHIFVNVISEITKSYVLKYDDKIDLIRTFILNKFPQIHILFPKLATKLKPKKQIKQNVLLRFNKIKTYLKSQIKSRYAAALSQKQTETECDQQSQFQFTKNDGQIKLIVQHHHRESSALANYHIQDNFKSISNKKFLCPEANTQVNIQ